MILPANLLEIRFAVCAPATASPFHTKGKLMRFALIIAEGSLKKTPRATSRNNMSNTATKPIFYGILASMILLGVYFAVLTLISGWNFAQNQFSSFWYFIISLAIGFGIQIGLYTHLRGLIKGMHGEGKVLGVTGTTSTAAMISCCAHYLANILPILGAVGIVTFVAQYQVELFWVGLLFNLGGIFYITNKIIKFKQT